jgi:hypothetical protein
MGNARPSSLVFRRFQGVLGGEALVWRRALWLEWRLHYPGSGLVKEPEKYEWT